MYIFIYYYIIYYIYIVVYIYLYILYICVYIYILYFIYISIYIYVYMFILLNIIFHIYIYICIYFYIYMCIYLYIIMLYFINVVYIYINLPMGIVAPLKWLLLVSLRRRRCPASGFLKDGRCVLLIIRLLKCTARLSERCGGWAGGVGGVSVLFFLNNDPLTAAKSSIHPAGPGTRGAGRARSLWSTVRNETFLNPRHLLCFPLRPQTRGVKHQAELRTRGRPGWRMKRLCVIVGEKKRRRKEGPEMRFGPRYFLQAPKKKYLSGCYNGRWNILEM